MQRWDRRNYGDDRGVPKTEGERPQGEVVMMDKDYKTKLEMEEHVSVPKRAYITREDLEVFGFTARCPGCMSLLQEKRRDKRTQTIV